MCEDQNLNIEAPESLKSFLDHNDKDSKPSEKKEDDAKPAEDATKEKANEMESWTIFVKKVKRINNTIYNIIYL